MAGPMTKHAPVFTIGHSTRPIEEFLTMLRSFEIAELADVRTIPKSRHNPQFNQEALRHSLGRNEIAYRHWPGLGGLRRPAKDSLNSGWRNASFRGYADYMQTGEFEQNLRELIKEAASKRIAVMCAEAVPWRCHRSLIADALTARGLEVRHIMTEDRANLHKLNPMAHLEGRHIRYPDPEPHFNF
jgi:uncharacterized protein (DUF488 family)